jgi:hypothetical protein
MPVPAAGASVGKNLGSLAPPGRVVTFPWEMRQGGLPVSREERFMVVTWVPLTLRRPRLGVDTLNR